MSSQPDVLTLALRAYNEHNALQGQLSDRATYDALVANAAKGMALLLGSRRRVPEQREQRHGRPAGSVVKEACLYDAQLVGMGQVLRAGQYADAAIYVQPELRGPYDQALTHLSQATEWILRVVTPGWTNIYSGQPIEDPSDGDLRIGCESCVIAEVTYAPGTRHPTREALRQLERFGSFLELTLAAAGVVAPEE